MQNPYQIDQNDALDLIVDWSTDLPSKDDAQWTHKETPFGSVYVGTIDGEKFAHVYIDDDDQWSAEVYAARKTITGCPTADSALTTALCFYEMTRAQG